MGKNVCDRIRTYRWNDRMHRVFVQMIVLVIGLIVTTGTRSIVEAEDPSGFPLDDAIDVSMPDAKKKWINGGPHAEAGLLEKTVVFYFFEEA